jgi:hypothetical protein
MNNPTRREFYDGYLPSTPREPARDFATPYACGAYDSVVWRGASDLISRHGRGAWRAAAIHFMDLNAAGDAAGAMAFLKIAGAVAWFEDHVMRRAN